MTFIDGTLFIAAIGLIINLLGLLAIYGKVIYWGGKIDQKTSDLYECIRRIENALTMRINRMEDK